MCHQPAGKAAGNVPLICIECVRTRLAHYQHLPEERLENIQTGARTCRHGRHPRLVHPAGGDRSRLGGPSGEPSPPDRRRRTAPPQPPVQPGWPGVCGGLLPVMNQSASGSHMPAKNQRKGFTKKLTLHNALQ